MTGKRSQTCVFAPYQKSIARLTIQLLLSVFGFLFISGASVALAQDYGASGSQSNSYGDSNDQNSPGELQPVYPGEPMNKPPVEAKIGPEKLRFYGTVLLNISMSDSDEVGQDVPLWPFPSTTNVTFADGTVRRAGDIHDTLFTARQSVFGVVLNPADPSAKGWNTSAEVEFDLFGTTPVDADIPEDRVLNQPRLRKAFIQLQRGDFKLVAGQDSIIISPMDPISLSHVAYPLGFSAGDLFGWLPQVRVDYNRKWGHNTRTLFQLGVLRPAFGDPRLGDQPLAAVTLGANSGLVNNTVTTTSGLGERASQPFYQGRVAISHPLHGSDATIGVGGHYGQERTSAQHTVDSWAFTFDYRIPILRQLILRGEGYLGSNLVPFGGGILQGVTAVGALNSFTVIHKLGDGGGWAELTFLATKKDVFYAGYSQDSPVYHSLLPVSGRYRNAVAWGSYFRKLTPGFTLAAEFSDWQFRTTAFTGNNPGPRGAFGRGNVVNIALAYAF